MRRQGAGLLLAPRSRDALARVLRRGEQAILLLNRRGYAGYVHCDTCGHALMCADCELSLTYHRRDRQAPLSPLRPRLRAAGGVSLVRRGAAHARGPGHRTARPGATNTGAGRPGVPHGLRRGRGRRPHADHPPDASGPPHRGSLWVPRWWRKVTTSPTSPWWWWLTPMWGCTSPTSEPPSGRSSCSPRWPAEQGVRTAPAGSWCRPGIPTVPCIRMALERDEEGFYREELAIRERLGYPPFADLIRLVTSSTGAEQAQGAARHLLEGLSPHFGSGELHGPASLPRLRGRYRWQVVVAARRGERARTLVGQGARTAGGAVSPARRHPSGGCRSSVVRLNV